MKSVKKAIIAALCAGTLVVGSVAGTMAYLTSTDEVVNTFTVGNVAITLDETDVDNSTAGADRDKANSYKIFPGQTYVKDPIVHVDSDSENCYLFVKVANEITAIEAEGNTTVAAQMTAKDWTAIDTTNGIYVYGTAAAPIPVAAGEDKTVFENFTIAGTVDNDTLKNYANKTITVTAYAIQADGFGGKTASEIWTAANFQ